MKATTSEIDRVCDDGVTFQDMLRYGEAWVISSESVHPVLAQEWIAQFHGDGVAADLAPSIDLVSFSHSQVIYEVAIEDVYW